MDYYLFWEAFGAIGATLGSIITAIAVIVAVVQYRQPFVKKAEVECNLSYPLYIDHPIEHLSIGIKNVGIRNIKIEMFYLIKGKRKFTVTTIQSDLFEKVRLPFMLEPEEKLTIYILTNKLESEFKRLYGEKYLPRFGRIYPIVQDSIGKVYKGKPIKIHYQ